MVGLASGTPRDNSDGCQQAPARQADQHDELEPDQEHLDDVGFAYAAQVEDSAPKRAAGKRITRLDSLP